MPEVGLRPGLRLRSVDLRWTLFAYGCSAVCFEYGSCVGWEKWERKARLTSAHWTETPEELEHSWEYRVSSRVCVLSWLSGSEVNMLPAGGGHVGIPLPEQQQQQQPAYQAGPYASAVFPSASSAPYSQAPLSGVGPGYPPAAAGYAQGQQAFQQPYRPQDFVQQQQHYNSNPMYSAAPIGQAMPVAGGLQPEAVGFVPGLNPMNSLGIMAAGNRLTRTHASFLPACLHSCASQSAVLNGCAPRWPVREQPPGWQPELGPAVLPEGAAKDGLAVRRSPELPFHRQQGGR